MEILDVLERFSNDMNQSNSTKDKQAVFKQYVTSSNRDSFMNIMKQIYHPLERFHVTSKGVLAHRKKKKFIPYPKDYSLERLLEKLSSQELTGHDALNAVLTFIQNHATHEDLICRIIDKDLKIRFGIKQMNNVCKNFLPIFEVSLGYEYPGKEAIAKGKWLVSRKLDGVRCVCIVKLSPERKVTSIEFYSRSGKEYETHFNKVKEDIQKNFHTNVDWKGGGVILDGEMCIIEETEHGKTENFKQIVSEIKRKNHVIASPCFVLFDMLTMEEFTQGTSKRTLSQRLQSLRQFVDTCKFSRMEMIEQHPYTEESLETLLSESKDKQWEGLILRKDTQYKGKRSKDILKMKEFHREEYEVQDLEFTTMRVIDPNTKLETEVDALKRVMIEHKGNLVGVGSGFSLEERQHFYKNPDDIKGKIISVQFFEESQDKDGNWSLRFPTFCGLYGKKREF
jgi:DNA ligase-1